MSVNVYLPHVLVVPEDKANLEMATGFQLEVMHARRIQVLNEVGGWTNVPEYFLENLKPTMMRYPNRHVILLLDFDNNSNRRSKVEERIPRECRDRVFLIGVKGEPEDFRTTFGNRETIGRNLATECREKRVELWQHDFLIDNMAELIRLQGYVRSFLFEPDQK